jgi:serine protease Do
MNWQAGLVALGLAGIAAVALAVPGGAQGNPATSAPPARTTGESIWSQVASGRIVPQSQLDVQMSFAPLVKRAVPAVVNVFTERVVASNASPFASDPVLRELFGYGQPEQRVQGSLGSGVIVGTDGVILTNAHVVKGADKLRVVLSDRREYPAELILEDERTDLAVLRIDTKGEALPVLPFADTRNLEVGDVVLAIGNPFGVGQTVTSGIISATARTDVGVSDYAFFLQTDAAINPGNSGGALINARGELVGVNTAIYSRSGGSNGIGFAIPAEMARRVVDAAVNDGRIVRPWLGLKGQGVSADMAASLGLSRPRGVLVSEIYPGGPAALADLRKGDIVLAIDGREVFDERGLKFLAATLSPGEAVTLDVRRAGADRSVRLTLAPPPGMQEAELKLIAGNNPFAGVEVASLSPALAEELGLDPFLTGVLATRMTRGSPGWSLGLRPGDLISAVNGAKVASVAELEAVVKREDGKGSWTAEVTRNGQKGTLRRRFF